MLQKQYKAILGNTAVPCAIVGTTEGRTGVCERVDLRSPASLLTDAPLLILTVHLHGVDGEPLGRVSYMTAGYAGFQQALGCGSEPV